MGTPKQPRQPAGTSQGGQFGPTRSAEPENIGLGGPAPTTPGEAFRAALRANPDVGSEDGIGMYDSCDEYLDTVEGEPNMYALMEIWSERLSEDLGLPNMFVGIDRTESLRNWWLHFGAVDEDSGLYITGNSFYGTELLTCTTPEYGDIEDQLVASYEASLPKARVFAEGAKRLMGRA